MSGAKERPTTEGASNYRTLFVPSSVESRALNLAENTPYKSTGDVTTASLELGLEDEAQFQTETCAEKQVQMSLQKQEGLPHKQKLIWYSGPPPTKTPYVDARENLETRLLPTQGKTGMSTLEEKIKKILEESSEPLRAVEIAKKIGHGYEKKDVNRVIYSMPDVEKVDKSPPKWRIRSRHGICPEDTSTASVSIINSAKAMAQRGVSTPQIEATSQAGEGQSNPSQGSDLELQEKLLEVLKQSPKPKSVLQLARELGKEGRRDVNPILHRLEKQGLVRKLSEDTNTKPLWQSVVHPVHSTSPCEKAPSSTIQGSEAGAVAQWKAVTLYTQKDGSGGEITFAPLQTKEILTSVLDEKLQPDASCEQNKASPDVEKTDCKTASSQVPLALSERKKIRKKLAANFTCPPTSRSSEESNDDLKKRITEIFETNKLLTTLEVSEKLGMQVRGDAMVLLKELKEDGIVEELAGKISSWKLA